MINLAIVIATFNRKNLLKKLLTQIFNQDDIKISSKIEIIVIIDGSTDGTEEMLNNDFPNVIKIFGDSTWWWTKCMNEGFKKALEIKADYILVLNDDNEIKFDYLKILLSDYNTLPADSILGSTSISIDEPNLINSAGTKRFIRWRLKFDNYINGFQPIFNGFNGVHPTWSLSGRGTLIPANLFQKLGFYDEKLVQYGSDDEYILRARKFGIHCFISWNAIVYNHLMLTSEGSAFKKTSLIKYIKSYFNPYSSNSLKKTIYIYRKYGNPILTPFYVIYVIIGSFKAYLFKY